MTFLNPFVLFGLAAAAIPILIHLLNKRKLRTIDFSTLSFLKELQRSTMRKITIRQWLLLLLRTFMIAFLVFAFSRPALRGNFGTIGSHAKTSIAVIIDNTASMDLHNERGTFLDQAKEQASQIIGMMQENDDAVIVRLSDFPESTMDAPSHDRQKLLTQVLEMKSSPKRRTIVDALRAASSLLRQSKNVNKEVYILTDGQRSTFASMSDEPAAAEPLFDPATQFYITGFSGSPAENIGIERVTIPPSLLQINKPVTVNAVIRNYGIVPVRNHLVSISIGPNRVMQKSVTLQGGQSSTVDFTVTPVRPGFITGSIELEDDPFEQDNTRYFSLSIPDKIMIALVTTDDRHSRYMTTALNVANTLSASGSVTVHTFSPYQISTTMLASADVVILSGVTDVQEQSARLLQQYVANGGSMIFFPAADTARIEYRYLDLFSVSAGGILSTPAQNPFTIDKVDFDFPIFTGMFDAPVKGKREFESPNITTLLNFPAQRSIRPIITLSNGSPLLWLREYQKGNVIGFSVPAAQQWSDLVFTGMFVPVLVQSVLYGTSQVHLGSTAVEAFAGETMELTAPELRRLTPIIAGTVRMIDPERRYSPLQTYSKMLPDGVSHTIFTGAEFHSTGHYYAVAGRDTILTVSVNIDRLESDGTLATQDEITALITPLGADEQSLTFPEGGSSLQEIVLQSRFGVELWRYFLLAAVLLGLLEMIIGREKREQ